MKRNLTCFKCWEDTAIITYEENRIYKVACECGCSYNFEHSSMEAAEAYHLTMLELHGEIDRNMELKAENNRLREERNAAVSQIKKSCKNCVNEDFCREDNSLLYGEGCGEWEWRGTERGAEE